MKLSLLDIRKKPSRILEAVEHNEDVIISSRGRDVARISSIEYPKPIMAAEEHPAYGIWADRDERPADELVRDLRKRRYSDL